MLIEVIFFIIFLILSAFFSASETAFLTINEIQVKKMLQNREKCAKTIANLKKKAHNVIIAILIGNNIANVSVSAIATHIATEIYGNKGISIAIGIITFILLIFGEVTPKTISYTKAKTFMKHSAKIIAFSCILFEPIIYMLNFIASNTSKVFKLKLEKTKGLTEEEIKTAILLGEEKGMIDKQEKKIINNVFDFSNRKVSDIFTPKSRVYSINSNINIIDFISFIKKHRYSRFPVYENNEENIIGIVYAKDILSNINNNKKGKITSLIKKAYFVHENKEIGLLMEEMRKRKQHMSIVVNEYGVVEGIITLEDIIEEIIGEIEDEKDKEKKHIIKIKKNEFLIDGLTGIEELKKIGIILPKGNYKTINGFLIKKIDKLPFVGDNIKYKKYEIIVEKMLEKRIGKIKIIKK